MKLVILHLLVFHAVIPDSARNRGPGTAVESPAKVERSFDHNAKFMEWDFG